MSAQHSAWSARRRTGVVLAVVAAVLAVSAGCGESPTPGASTPASAKADKCAAGAYKDPNGVYCLVVPEGAKANPTNKDDYKSVDQFITSDYTFNIEYWPAGAKGLTLDNMKQRMADATTSGGLKEIDSADLDGGGVYKKFHNESYKETSQHSLIEANGMVIECVVIRGDDKPLNPDDSCKTIRGQ